MRYDIIVAVLLLTLTTGACTSFLIAQELYNHLMMNGYNAYAKPPLNSSEGVTEVTVQVILSQIIALDAQKSIMVSNIILNQTWTDARLRWNPKEYGGMKTIQIPAEGIWTPDIVLVDNADGILSYTPRSSATVRYDGNVKWNCPVIFKSTCRIDATYFPFDTQNCSMTLASWSYDARDVFIVAATNPVDLSSTTDNGEWDIAEVRTSAFKGNAVIFEKSEYTLFSHSKISFFFTLRRLPLFYCAFLVAPCLGLSLFTAIVFCLPAASEEKLTLSVSVLLAHIFYFLVIGEIMPSSTSELPLIAVYLLLNVVIVTLSISLVGVVLNIHHKFCPAHESISHNTLIFVMRDLPRLLCMSSHASYTVDGVDTRLLKRNIKTRNENFIKGRRLLWEIRRTSTFPPELCDIVARAIESTLFIGERMAGEIRYRENQEEWRFIAKVLDRAFFIICSVLSTLSSLVLVILIRQR